MKKIIALTEIKNLFNIDCYVQATKGIDSGAHGKAFEGAIKLALTGRVQTKNLVSSNKRKEDLKIKGIRIEIKSGCGTLDNVKNVDVVIYSPTSTIENAYILNASDFLNGLESIGLVRHDKKMSNGKIKTAIQSFKHNNKATRNLYAMLETYGEKLA